MKAIEVLPTVNEREEILDLKLMDGIHNRTGPFADAHTLKVRAFPLLFRTGRIQRFGRNHPRRPHHVQDAGGKPQEQKHDQPPRRNSQARDRSASRYPLPAARPQRVRSTTENPGRSPTDRWSVVDPNYCRRDGRSEHGRAVRRDASTAHGAQPRRAEVFHDYRFRVRRRRPCYRHPRRFSRLCRRPKAARNIRSG